ncbi:MAG: helix-turn-helix domain-containing protein [Nitrospira sp.]|nr:helix-turn-helix domain-containing protein [Nitrospira sp.]MDH4243250.1 helix-turn-helix domain-containing protein [Nitrospira sp.]MDH4356002.1 helix-turn-helix domain-containing protein [Nitrospira sp.]MDH5317405.1 helix-turn-helix domain-containing protein [Nitrospira sp.]
MRTGRPMTPLTLTMPERETLQQWVRRPKTAQALAQRAQIILTCAEGQPNTAVARVVRVAPPTVCKWRQRFVTHRLDGLLDDPRPGAPRTVTDAAIERIVTYTLETTPVHATHWSTRGMAQRSGVSRRRKGDSYFKNDCQILRSNTGKRMRCRRLTGLQKLIELVDRQTRLFQYMRQR